jgi:hypothetical protein
MDDGELLVTLPLNVVPSVSVTVAVCPLAGVVLLHPASKAMEITNGTNIVARMSTPVSSWMSLPQ